MEEEQEFTPIGRVNFHRDNRVFGIKESDRFQHIYCLGKTGTGKSTLLLNMAMSDINRGKGLCVLDPHGDLSQKLIPLIPERRRNDLIYFNPGSEKDYISFNPILHIHPNFHHIVASGLVSTFKKIWSDSWGPRLEHILRYCILTLLDYQRGSLLDIQPLLTDPEFRKSVLSHVTNQTVISFWHKEFAGYSPRLRAEAISPILNKVGMFAASAPLKRVVGQVVSGLNISSVMDEGKILIANLSKGEIGEDVCSVLGSVLVTAIGLGSLQRARIPEEKRRPFFLYIDECHSFLSSSISDILSESRKYKLGMFLTHQYLDQLPEEISSAIFGNIGTLICFRIGASDAEILSREFEPDFTEYDLVNLPRFMMYLKLMIDGATSKPFSAMSISSLS